MMKNCRWLIYWLYAGMALTLSGCCHMCEEEFKVPKRALTFENGYSGYWLYRSVVLTRPLRIYLFSHCDAKPEYAGSCLLEDYVSSESDHSSVESQYYDVPAGTEIFLRKLEMQHVLNRSIKAGYFIYVDIPLPEIKSCSVVYMAGYDDKMVPFPWASTIKPEESFHPVDIEKLFPGGKWGN